MDEKEIKIEGTNFMLLKNVFTFLSIIFLLINCKDKNEVSKVVPDNISKNSSKKIIFFGNSLTAGLGIYNPDDAYPGIISAKLKKDGFDYEVVNAGVSGDTTSSGLARLDWVISSGMDIFILELGANDSMRGVKIDLIENNLIQIIQKVREKNPKVKILLIPMKAFPNLGPYYGKGFEKVYEKVSKSENVPLSPFLLLNVATIRDLNQEDGIHPTSEGHKIMAENIYPSLKKLL